MTEVRGFFGLDNYYRRFVLKLSQIPQPMIDMTKKGNIFWWSPACQEAFDDLKKIPSSSEVMAYPASEGLFILDTGASDEAVSVVL